MNVNSDFLWQDSFRNLNVVEIPKLLPGGRALRFYQIPTMRAESHGLILWRAGIALAHFLSEPTNSASMFRDIWSEHPAVLELGTGTGVVGIVLAALGANVVLTDYKDAILEVCAHNVNVNLVNIAKNDAVHSEPIENAGNMFQYAVNNVGEYDLPENVSISYLDWNDPSPFSLRFDYIVCADVLQYETEYQALVDTLDYYSHDNTMIFLSYERRRAQIEGDFFSRFSQKFSFQILEPSDVLPESLQPYPIIILWANKKSQDVDSKVTSFHDHEYHQRRLVKRLAEHSWDAIFEAARLSFS